MTTKDYKLLAKAIAEAKDICSWPMAHDLRKGIDIATEKVCDALLVDNCCFDRQRFLMTITSYQEKG